MRVILTHTSWLRQYTYNCSHNSACYTAEYQKTLQYPLLIGGKIDSRDNVATERKAESMKLSSSKLGKVESRVLALDRNIRLAFLIKSWNDEELMWQCSFTS